MQDLGRIFIVLGLVVVAVGVVLSLTGKLTWMPWLGRLPGDLYIERQHFTLYFPLTTSVLISVVLTLLVYLFRR